MLQGMQEALRDFSCSRLQGLSLVIDMFGVHAGGFRESWSLEAMRLCLVNDMLRCMQEAWMDTGRFVEEPSVGCTLTPLSGSLCSLSHSMVA